MSEDRDQVADEPIVDSTETVADEANAQGDDQTQLEEGAEEANPDDETEEIEHDGKKYSVPKGIKPLLLMQADYTRKTQDLAESRKALDTDRASVSQQAELVQALRPEIGKVQALRMQLEAFDAVTPQQWGQMYADDPGSAKTLEIQQQQLRRSLDEAERELTAKEQTWSQAQRETLAKQAAETWATLSNDIKGWDEPTARKVVDYAAKEFGVSLEDLRSADARTWKMLHRLEVAETKVKAAEARNKTAQRQEKVAGIEPARTVGQRASGYKPGLDDSLPIEEWMRRRNALRKAG